MTKDLFALSLGFAGLILWTDAAFAAPQCGPRDAVLANLAKTYSESRRSIGVAADRMVMEVFASEATGTWSINVTTPDGATCLVASGKDYETVVGERPATGSPA